MVPDKINPYSLRFIILAIVVCIAATALSGFLGLLASLLYGGLDVSEGRNPQTALLANWCILVGLWGGSISGLLAAIIWCGRMLRRIRNGEVDGLGGKGRWDGIKVGVIATLWLHASLMLTADFISGFESPNSEGLVVLMFLPVIGLVFGISAGLILGAVFGYMCQAMAKSTAGELNNPAQNKIPQP